MQSLKWGGAFALTLALGATTIAAQEQTREVAPSFGFVPVEIHQPGAGLDIPQPPGAIQHTPLPSHAMPPVPEGGPSSVPEPNSPPMQGPANGGPGAPCDINYWQNEIVAPGGSFSQIGEPSMAINRDTAFATWNWGAALSLDSGETWTYVNPSTKFPSIDGGFCCDQRVTYVPSFDMTVWYLQYSKSSTTQLGHCRIAISPSRTDLANNSWHSYTFAPDNFGFGTGEWLDFPDISYSNGHLYCCSNIFRVSDNGYVDSVVWKMQLSQLDAAVGVNYWFWTRLSTAAIGGGGSFRLAQNCTSTQYMASHVDTANMRVYRNADSPSNASMFSNDRGVGSWSGGSYSAQAPNGVNWAARADSRIQGGYYKSGEYGFMWHVGRRPSSGRAQCYVRVAQFRTSDNTLIGTQDIWNSTLAFLYPAVAVNASGEPGYTCAYGQGDGNASGTNPRNFYRVVDPTGCGVDFAGGAISVAFSGEGPTSSTWGDYFTVQRHNSYTNTFVASGMARTGGSQRPRYIWFGKEEDTPNTTLVTVEDNIPVTVPITVTHTDLNDQKNGSTTFTREYVASGRYELIAPSTVTSGSNTYRFCYWGLDVNGGTAFVNQPDGQTTLSVDNIGNADDRARAFYSLQTIVSVNDRNVAGSVAITVGTTDLDGLKNGSTSFTRRYKTADGPFSFTAPSSVGAQPFRRWYINNVAQAIGQTTISVSPSASTMTIECEYCSHVHGSYSVYGTGCVGSNGVIPRHTSSSHPDTGQLVTHSVTGLRGPTPAVMFLGFSNTLWNGFPLPLSLGFIGSNPACNVLAEGFLQLPITINGAGAGSRTFRVTSDPAAIGMHTYTQVIAADLFLSDPVPLVVSNGLDMLIGGSSIGGQRCP